MMANYHFIVFWALINFHGVFMVDYGSSHYLGTHVDLECESEKPVDCIWKRNEAAININDNYHYLFSNGSVTTDCSIQISSFNEYDIGNWTCWRLATDESDGELLNSHQLTLKENQMDDVKNSSKFTIAVRKGWAVILGCKFNTTLEECHWFRNSEPVIISNRYKFINFNRTGSDCSINITSLKSIDLGGWQCTTSANNIFGYRSSNVAWLIAQEPSESQHMISIDLPTVSQNYITEHPGFISANIGDKVNLRCAFRDPVHCVWLRKGRPIHVGHHYYYATNTTIGSKRSNCTLTISNVILNDIGRWTCFGAAHDSDYALKSSSVHITQNKKDELPFRIYATTLNRVSYEDLGENLTLNCAFVSNVYCDWRRNGYSVKISNRYSFVNRNITPSYSCSITISPLKYFDAGNWSCSYKQTGAIPIRKFTASTTTLYVTPKVTMTMNNRELSSKDTIPIEDMANDNNTLMCAVESRSHPPKLNWKILEEIFPGDFKYVKVDENVFLGKLYWKPNSKINFTRAYQGHRVSFARITLTLLCEFEFSEKRIETTAVQITKQYDSPPVATNRRFSHTNYMPSRIPLLIGDSVTLNCTFNKPVNCIWQMNDIFVTNSPLYKYVDTSDGVETINCSIIVNFTEFLVNSTWRCQGIYNNETVKASPTTLYVMATPTNPLIRWRSQVVNTILYPEMKRILDDGIPSYSYNTRLLCMIDYINPSPTMQWEANGIVIAETVNYQFLFYDTTLRKLESMKNVTELRCVVRHRALKSPKYAVVKLESYNIPTHPVIMINGEIAKTNVTLALNDISDEIVCMSQNGYPSANLSWELDGQKIAEYVFYNKVVDFKYTTKLYWHTPGWKLFKKPMQLNCVAEHPGWDTPKVALANITLAYSPTKDRLQLLNENQVMKKNDIFVFHCISSYPLNCSMMLNYTIVKEIPPVATVPSNDLIEGHVVEQCYIKLPPFGMQYVGMWQCTNGISDKGQLNSNVATLTPFEIPLKPRIEMEKSDGFYMNENIEQIILKTAEEKLKLKCVVERSNPASKLQWVLNGNNISDNQNSMTISTNLYQHDSVLRWDSSVRFSPTHNVAILQCNVFFPTSETIFQTTKIGISVQKNPSKPVLFFNDKVITGKVDVPLPKDFSGFKCISQNSNPAPQLHWQVNGQGISGQYKNYLVATSRYTAELQWDPKNDEFLYEGPIKLACVVIHPSLHSPIIFGIEATLKATKGVDGRITGTVITPLPNQNERTTEFHYYGIALLSAIIIIVAVLIAIIYVRIRMKRSSSGSSSMNFSNFIPCFGRKQSSTGSPLIKYEHCTGEKECQASIISYNSEN